MDEALAAYSALADKNRLRILCALHQSPELCACQIVELLGISGAAVSRHLSLLQRAGLCHSRKDGRWVYFSLAENPYLPLRENLLGHPLLQNDSENLRAILCVPPEELCKMQRDGKCCC